MDRLNQVHRAFRVELPKSIVNFDQSTIERERFHVLTPFVFRMMGIIGFLACGAGVVAVAGFLALNV